MVTAAELEKDSKLRDLFINSLWLCNVVHSPLSTEHSLEELFQGVRVASMTDNLGLLLKDSILHLKVHASQVWQREPTWRVEMFIHHKINYALWSTRTTTATYHYDTVCSDIRKQQLLCSVNNKHEMQAKQAVNG